MDLFSNTDERVNNMTSYSVAYCYKLGYLCQAHDSFSVVQIATVALWQSFTRCCI